ncbi:MAG: enoyl-CoA hydratase/isomerase family protein [Burkholderiaceae bacterium]
MCGAAIPGEVQFDEKDGIARLTLHAPGRKNAMSVAMWRQLRELVQVCAARPSVRVLVIAGAGNDFCAGADISEFAEVRYDRESGETYHEDIIRPALQALLDCKFPVVAAIRGHCVGGGLEIAACCDVRVCEEGAQFGVPVLYRGFPLAPFEMACVMAAFGKAATMQLLLEGNVIDAAQAQRLEVVQEVVPSDQFDARINMLATRLASAAPLAVASAKHMARTLAPMVSSLSLPEQNHFYAFLDSRDYREGIAAFLEKRAPKFTGS